MAKVLLINPNRWGRGITHIWIASHSAILKKNNHEVELFDATFYKDWSLNEIKYQSNNKMYKPSNYDKIIIFKSNDVKKDLEKKIKSFKPHVVFWSALSSHIHAEGEYANIQNGYELIKDIKSNILKISGGLQATAAPEIVLNKMKKIDYLIRGESELVLLNICNLIDKKKDIKSLSGLVFKHKKKIIKNKKQNIIENLDAISPYDYQIFDKQVLLRPYNGKIVKAVDYELSRGCIYSCNYCVETIIQKYYNFNTFSKSTGAIKNFKSYLRHKSSKTVFGELRFLNKQLKVELIRCQDTNFLTNDRKILQDIANKIRKSDLNIKLYIETRPEGINKKSIELLKDLKVDGIGMGVELADAKFREDSLNRFTNHEKIITAFKMLRKYGIKRTAYNIIGLPNQNEESILETIKFNKILDPDNITVQFYSPYKGTKQQIIGKEQGIFDDYEFDVDSALRSKTKDQELNLEVLEKYKKNFVDLVKNV
jgi:radical SAM superfamily enzyme YgiQ (UPF0313 family)